MKYLSGSAIFNKKIKLKKNKKMSIISFGEYIEGKNYK